LGLFARSIELEPGAAADSNTRLDPETLAQQQKESDLAQALTEIDPDSLSPRDALQAIYDLKQKLS